MAYTMQKHAEYTEAKIKSHVETLEKSDHMIHMSHINDFKSFMGAHSEFLKAQDRFDQKLKIVVDLEKAN